MSRRSLTLSRTGPGPPLPEPAPGLAAAVRCAKAEKAAEQPARRTQPISPYSAIGARRAACPPLPATVETVAAYLAFEAERAKPLHHRPALRRHPLQPQARGAGAAHRRRAGKGHRPGHPAQGRRCTEAQIPRHRRSGAGNGGANRIGPEGPSGPCAVAAWLCRRVSPF